MSFPDHIKACSGTEAEVCNDIARRQKLGIAKYGTTVRTNPLTQRQWFNHAYEECLDMAVYLKRAIEEMDDGTTRDQEGQTSERPDDPQGVGPAFRDY